jgi:hypothetical protein
VTHEWSRMSERECKEESGAKVEQQGSDRPSDYDALNDAIGRASLPLPRISPVSKTETACSSISLAVRCSTPRD